MLTLLDRIGTINLVELALSLPQRSLHRGGQFSKQLLLLLEFLSLGFKGKVLILKSLLKALVLFHVFLWDLNLPLLDNLS
jgi:hypothetical protein